MKRAIGTALMLAGLVAAGFGLYVGLSGASSKVELTYLAAGIVLFLAGRALAGEAGGSS